jgi:hypothetical protein
VGLYRRSGTPLLRVVVVAAVAGAVLPGFTLIWLWRQGVLAEARVALIDFNRFYVAQDLSARTLVVKFANAIGFRVKTDPLWTAGAVGSVAAAWDLLRTRRLDPVAALAVLWGGAAAIVIAVNGVQLFNTYFIQALPPLAILTGWVIARARGGTTVQKVAALAALIAIAVPIARKNYPSKVLEVVRADLQQWRGRGDTGEYLQRFQGSGGGYSAADNAALAIYVRAHTSRDDLIYQFGINSAVVYFAADRLMAQRFLRVNEFVPSTFPSPGFTLDTVASELALQRPAYLIFEHLPPGSRMADAVDRLPQAPELVTLLRVYQRETQIGDFTLYRRRP